MKRKEMDTAAGAQQTCELPFTAMVNVAYIKKKFIAFSKNIFLNETNGNVS